MKKNYYLCADFLRSMKYTTRILLLFLLLSVTHMGLLRAEDYSVRFYDDNDGLSHWHISQIIQDSTGMIWVATWNGLNRFDGHHFVTFKPTSYPAIAAPNDRVRRFRLTESNHLQCLIDERVYLFDTHFCFFDTLSADEEREAYSQLHRRFNPDFDRPALAKRKQYGHVTLQNIWEEYIDRQHNRWLYDDHGIYIVTPRPARGTRIDNKEVRSMHRMRNGDIWVSVRDSKQVMVYDSAFYLRGYMDERGRLQQHPVSFENMVYCMHETPQGDVLLGCKPGCVIAIHNGCAGVSTYPELRNAYDIQADKDGHIWVATFGFGLWKEENGIFSLIPATEGMKIRRLLFLEDGMLLAATTDGVLVVNKDNISLHQREVNSPHSLSSNAIMCLCLFNEHLYAGTEGGGLNRLIGTIQDENWEWECWAAKDGLENDIVFELYPWSKEELFIQGNSYLSLFNSRTNEFTNYSRSFFFGDDDSQLVFGEVPPILINDTQMLIAPSYGLFALDKQKLHPEVQPIRIALSSIKRNGEDNYAVDDVEHIVLAPSERNLVMQFAALDYRNNRKLLYRTRLYPRNKRDAPWRTPTTVNEVIMQDMQPGEYIFEICSTDAYGHWQNNTRQIRISVLPTFIESTWGKVILGGLALFIVLSITIAFLQVRFSKKKRAETLAAYLELQERLAHIHPELSKNEPLPVPEILAPGYTSENERFLNSLHRFMDEHINDSEMSIDDIAKVVNMSRSTLNRKMHELFNLSAKDFVQAARIKHACQLLRSTDMPTKEIAYACGFSDPNYFSKCFKTNTGKTPTEWRERGE